MEQLRLGLVIANPELSNEVQNCLKTLPSAPASQQPAIGDAAAFLDQLEQLRLDVLVIDLTRFSEPFESIIRRIKSCSSAPLIIALNDTADPEIILGAIRAGANEFLYPPLELGLKQALERLSAERMKMQAAPSRHRGKTLGFVSAKGGCGATTIACHIAVEIQKATEPGGFAGRSGHGCRLDRLPDEIEVKLHHHRRGPQCAPARYQLLEGVGVQWSAGSGDYLRATDGDGA